MQQIKWGIIGCGDVTEVKSGPAFNKVSDSGLVAVMRRNEAKAADYARRHNVPKWYGNADDLINDPGVNAVYVATPPLQHEEYTIQALQAGKPVYVEKPMALNAAAARRMQQAAEKTGVKLCVAHYRRRWPLFQKIKALVAEGTLGKIQYVTLQLLQPHQSNITAKTEEAWRLNPALSGGGLFYDLAPHQLDILYYLFGTPQRITGLSFNGGRHYEVDDTVSGQMLFENGAVFNGLWSFSAPEKEKVDRCEIVGERGEIVFSFFGNQPVRLLTDKEETFPFEALPHVQQPMIEAVVQYFLNRANNPCSAAEGVEVMRMMEAFTGPAAASS